MKRGIFLLIAIFVIFSLGVVSAQTLTPGSGWTGSTNVPSAIGSSGQYGYDAKVIAHWDHVPYQAASGTINIGVLAYHVSGIAKVSFSVNNGPWLDITTPTLNPETNVEEYWVTLDESLFPSNFAGNVELRAIAYPNTGTPRVLQGTNNGIGHDSSMIVSVDRAGTLPDNIAYATVTGSDTNNCLTSTTACRTITRAMNSIAVSGNNLDGAEVRLGEGNWQLPSTASYLTPNRWFTITSIAGTNRDNVIIGSVANGAMTSRLKLSKLSIVRGTNLFNYQGYIWIDNSKVYKQTAWTVNDGAYSAADLLGYATPESGNNEYNGYFTDVYINNTGQGPSNLVLARNIIAETTDEGYASGTQTLINYWVYKIVQIPPAHADYYQFYGDHDDIIIKGGGNIVGGTITSRGLATSEWGVTNLAVDGLNLNWNGAVFSFCGPDLRNIIVKNSYFATQGDWCFEWAGLPYNLATMSNILFQDTTFNILHAGPGASSPIQYPLNPLTGLLPPSPQVTYSTTATTAPSAPSSLDATTISSTSLRITWHDNSNNENGFTLQYKLSSSSNWQSISIGPNVQSYDHSGLNPSTSYDYRIRSYNTVGSSAFSNTDSAITNATLPTPFDFSVTSNPTSGSVQNASKIGRAHV